MIMLSIGCWFVITAQSLKIFPVCVRFDFRVRLAQHDSQGLPVLIFQKNTPRGRKFVRGKRHKTVSASQKMAREGLCGL